MEGANSRIKDKMNYATLNFPAEQTRINSLGQILGAFRGFSCRSRRGSSAWAGDGLSLSNMSHSFFLKSAPASRELALVIEVARLVIILPFVAV